MSSTPGPSVVRPDEMRRHNRTALLRFLHTTGPSTRTRLAGELGLNRSTIKTLVDALADSGVVVEKAPRSGRQAGRPSLLVLPQPQAAVVLAVDIRVERVSIALLGLGGQILGRNSWKLYERARVPDEVITHIIESTMLLTSDLNVRPAAGGVSVPGVIRRSDGYVHEAPNLHWTDVALGDRLRKVLNIPITVGNDAELAAVAEHIRGAARGATDAVFISGDIGVGGGVIAAGSSLRGGAGYVGELGHMAIRPDGRPCYCGNHGCWETEVGEAALCRSLGLPEGTPRGAVLVELKKLAQDPSGAQARLDPFVQWLILGLINVVNLLGPQLIVLGDLFTALPESIVHSVAQQVRQRSLVSRAVGGTELIRSTLGADVKLLGAAEVAFESVLDTV